MKEQELSKKCLVIKGLSKAISNINKKYLDTRVFYGFLLKKHKSNHINQKRWFFIVSSRPLFDLGYENDDYSLEEKDLHSSISFDTLYYFACENENDSSPAKGNLNMVECHGIERKDSDGEFNLSIDMGDKKFELISELLGDRDKWYEVLKNARKTAKDIKQSQTKKPRNINRLINILKNEGVSKVREICEGEKDKVIHDFSEM